MPILFGGSGQYLRRTASLPTSAAWTMAAWVRVRSVRASNYQYFLGAENALSSATKYVLVGYDNGGTFHLSTNTATGSISAPTIGQWFFIGLYHWLDGTYKSTAVWAHAGVAFTSSGEIQGSDQTIAGLWLGNDSWDEWTNTDIAHVRVWDATLTPAELALEMYAPVPVRRAGLNVWAPLWTPNHLADQSGNGRYWTAAGSLKPATDGPVSVATLPALRYWWMPAADAPAAGGVTVSPAAASAIGAVVAPTVVNVVALAPTNAGAVGAVVNPTVVNVISLAPTPASAIGAVVNPTVINVVSLAPAQASAVGAVANPTVIQGALALAPVNASAVGAVVNPTVIVGALAITPTNANVSASVVDPAVILGSLGISPAVASAIGAVVDPTVIAGGGDIVAPAAAAALGDVVNPTVISGALSLAPTNASVSTTSAAPTVVNVISLAPANANAAAAVVDPVVLHGALSLTPEPAWSTVSIAAPGVIQSSLVLAPAAVSAIGAVADPTITILDAVPDLRSPLRSTAGASRGQAQAGSSGRNTATAGASRTRAEY